MPFPPVIIIGEESVPFVNFQIASHLFADGVVLLTSGDWGNLQFAAEWKVNVINKVTVGTQFKLMVC